MMTEHEAIYHLFALLFVDDNVPNRRVRLTWHPREKHPVMQTFINAELPRYVLMMNVVHTFETRDNQYFIENEISNLM